MSRSTRELSGSIAWSGRGLLYLPLGRVVNSASQQFPAGVLVPWAATIVFFGINITTQFTHASSAISAGSHGTLTTNLNAFSLQNVATGFRDLTGNLASASVAANTAFVVSLAAADTTGVLGGLVVLEPST